jgi:uncharacterized membrane protein YeiH
MKPMAAGGEIGALARVVLLADLAGTAVFAAEGTITASGARLDLLGGIVIAFVTALGGGIVRDLLLGATPPVAFRRQSYFLAVLAGALAAILAGLVHRGIGTHVLLTLDALGLALFAVAGTEKALEFGSPGFAAIVFGGVTAVGGGVVRDVLLNSVPAVLRIDFYATAALAGACVLLMARAAGLSPRMSAVAGGGACFGLRMAGALLHWHLPVLG